MAAGWRASKKLGNLQLHENPLFLNPSSAVRSCFFCEILVMTITIIEWFVLLYFVQDRCFCIFFFIIYIHT